MKDEISDFIYNGMQYFDNTKREGYPLYTCLHKGCGTTIMEKGFQPERLLNHIKENHYKRYWEIQNKMKEFASRKYLEYVVGK
jgi:hypothetical protein